MPPAVDLDALLSHRGGFFEAYLALTAYAGETIKRYASDWPASSSVRLLVPEDVANQTFQRIIEEGQVWTDGEKLYLQLRRYISDSVHGLAKAKSASRFVNCATVGDGEGGSLDADTYPDHERLTPAEAGVRHEYEEQAKQIFQQLCAQLAPGSKELELCKLLLEGWRDRADASQLLGISVEEYDKVFKRVKRAAEKCRSTFMKQEKAV